MLAVSRALLLPVCVGALLSLGAACKASKSSQSPESGSEFGPDPGAGQLVSEADGAPSPESSPEALPPRPPDTIYRSELMRATKGGRPAYLLAQLQPEPYRPRGAREGWRISSVFPADPGLCAPGCDLFPGDIILTVNGSPLERPEQLSALIAEIETMQTLDVRLVRDQKLHERTFAIVDDPPA